MTNIVIPYGPFEYQVPLHVSDKRFSIIRGGRRVGKSNAAFQELLRHALSQPNQICWWVSPTYRDAQETGYEFFNELYEVLAPAIQSVHISYLRVTFTNGSRIYFKGSDKWNSLRGRGLNFVVVDEAAFCHVDVWKKAIRPALSDKKGRAIITSTPNGRNWFYDLYTYATNSVLNKNSWNAYHWPSNLSPLLDEVEIEDARNLLSPNDFKQEYLAEFITPGGMIYEDFCDENIYNDSNSVDISTMSIYLGIDFGFASPSTVGFFAVDETRSRVYLFDEIYSSRTSIEKLIILIQSKLQDHKITRNQLNSLYTDPAGNAEELSSGLSPVDCLRKEGFVVVNKGTRINPGIALVRSFILNAKGQRRFFVHERCKEHIRSIYGYSYAIGRMGIATDTPDKDGIHDHACDALRYFFVNKFDNAKYIFSDLKQESYSLSQSGNKNIMKRCGDCRRPFISRSPKNLPPFICKECESKHVI